ncbi:MAG: zinc ribbon domain-containing protein [Actinobacteria bacterium]|nr:zinc ribbon domain-containing protein [Actinomycetota bacterium]
MPLYEFKCRDCGHVFDAQLGFDEDPPAECPACGSAEIRKVFSPVGISFRGSGFYKNDSRSSSSSSSSSSTLSGTESGSTSETASSTASTESTSSGGASDGGSSSNTGSNSGSGGSASD